MKLTRRIPIQIKQIKPAYLKIVLPILAVVLLVVGVGSFTFLRSSKTRTAAAATGSELKTAKVSRGDISLTASGSGTLITSRETSLGFSTTGIVAKINVQVGEKVKEGAVLAELEEIDDLKIDVNLAELDLLAAKQDLDTFQRSGAANIANAQLAVVSAKQALDEAKSKLVSKGMSRCDQDTTDAYYAEYMKAQRALEDLGDAGGNQNYYLTKIVPAKDAASQAYATYMYCAGYTEYEIDSSQANYTLAQATLSDAEATLKTLKENEGLDPDELSQAENKVDNAELALETAQEKLDGIKLTAPFDGTVISIGGQVGDEVETGAFITFADLDHPQVEFVCDETDLDKIAVGETAEVVFDAFPEQTFSGIVTQVNPELETVNGYQAIKGKIQLDFEDESDTPEGFFAGLNAGIEIIKGESQNALLVPTEALRDLGNDEYGLFVLEQGQPRFRLVKIGLTDTSKVEIVEGVKEGDVVTTGIMETN